MLDAIGEFLTDLRVEGRGILTLEAHDRYLKRVAAWYEREGLHWQEVDRRVITRYVRLYADKAISTRNNLATSLRTFYAWCVVEGYVAMSPAAHLKTVRRARPLPRALTQDQVRRLIAYVRQLDGRRGQRDRVLMLTALYGGLRASELTALRRSDIDLAGSVINIRTAKGDHGRAVPIHPDLLPELGAWLDAQAVAGDDPPVFSLDGRPIVSERAGKVCREHSKALRIPFCTHSLRHTFATMMLRRSGNLYAVSKAIGHLDIKQTEIYLSANTEDIRVALDMLPGLEEW